MAPYDMGKLINKLQQDKLFSSNVTNPMLHEFGTERVSLKNIDMASMLRHILIE